MRKRRPQQAWKNALTLVALTATLLAFSLQLFERRARQEEARRAAVRLEEALAGSGTQLHAEIAEESPQATGAGREPRADTVLRRLEAGGSSLEQALGPAASREAFRARFNAALASLARQTEEADRALRQDLEELRAARRRKADAASKSMALTLVALLCLVGRALPELWPRREAAPEELRKDV